VKAATGADVALINGGSFRIDSTLSPDITRQDLRDTFIYDGPDAVVLAELTAEELRDCCAHGSGKTGQGGFLQVSEHVDRVNARTGSVRVAMVKHLLIDNEDQFQERLARARGCAPGELLARLKGPDPRQWSLIDCVVRGAPSVRYCAELRIGGATKPPSNDMERFIALTDAYIARSRALGIEHPATVRFLDPLAIRPTAAPEVAAARKPLRDFAQALIAPHLGPGLDAFIVAFAQQLAYAKAGYENEIPYDDYFDAALRYDWALRHVPRGFD
jgi:hypothetical protein